MNNQCAVFFSLNFAMQEVLNGFTIIFRLSVFNMVSYQTLSPTSMRMH